MPPTTKERRKQLMWGYLSEHARGLQNRRTARQIASEFETNIRTVQDVLEDLRRTGRMIVSSRAHGGVFIPETIEEAAMVLGEELKAAQTHICNMQILRRNIEEHFGKSLKLYLKPAPENQLDLLDLCEKEPEKV